MALKQRKLSISTRDWNLNPERAPVSMTSPSTPVAAGAAYLQGCFSEMEHFIEVVLNRAKTVLDSAGLIG